MKLQDLFLGFPAHFLNSGNPEVFNIQFDSRKIEPGSLFVAIRGNKSDGHQFLSSAVKSGACALVVAKASHKNERSQIHSIPVIEVDDTRKCLDFISAQFYGWPSRNLVFFGITGTNGKTSVGYLLEHIMNGVSQPTGVIGTIDHHLGSQVWSSEMTTPDPIFLQMRLAEMLKLGAKAAALEISSHALEQNRADSVALDVAIFTNLTQDHLDYHLTMDSYFLSKQKLFSEVLQGSSKKKKTAVINTSDPWGVQLSVPKDVQKLTYGKSKADFTYEILEMDATKTVFQIEFRNQKYIAHSTLTGEHNVQNALAALVATYAVGVDLKLAVSKLQTFRGVPGRLQRVASSAVSVFVDYAHSPDALENVLRSLQQIRNQAPCARGKIWLVFGCGGDRDKGKRPQMAQIAEKYSDRIMVTSDNPRTELPEAIIADIIAGFSSKAQFEKQVDRKKAIEAVLDQAQSADFVLITGKGHEDYQIMGTKKIHFSDYEVAENYLKGKK